MAEESDLDISTLPIEEDNMDLDCESLIKALAFYNKIVEQSDSKEIKKKSRKMLRVNALAIVKIVASQNTYIAQLEGRIQEMEKSFASKASTDQALISEAVAREVEKNLPAMAIAQAQTPTYAEMATLRAKEPGNKVPSKRERSKSRQKPAMKTDKNFSWLLSP
ncbi:hypothetical protein CEXT_364951 [Caerostris extrusa]|uniref:Uncharacterized protein n=1 Tax=Caerostris extrusa TaxID=172846 RepID=A0AAV4QVE1_CAEEX|nr:hypothetical protein CEXT_364951 [Caerostris extrusa]